MPSVSSRHHNEVLKEQAEERQAERDKRTPLQQLEVLQRRGVSVPSTSEKELKELDFDLVKKTYCREVIRLVSQVRGNN